MVCIFNGFDSNLESQQKQLALQVQQLTDKDGFQATAIPSLDLIRASNISVPLHTIYTPSLCVIVQGAKTVLLGTERYTYDTTSYLVASVHLPIIGQIIKASPKSPYLGIRLGFSFDQIYDIIKSSKQVLNKTSDLKKGLIVTKSSGLLLDALHRLLALLKTPDDIPTLAPLCIKEILYRILQAESGAVIRQFTVSGSHAIAQVITLIRNDFARTLHIEELAEVTNMSPSSLYQYFKRVTAMTPLQYQKQIRLQEARRLLLSQTLEAADAAYKVGYESPTQFSREYARMFGLPPMSDIKRLKNSIYANF